MKSVIYNINTQEFTRIRIGIGHPKNNEDMISFVIGAIPEEDLEYLIRGVEKGKEAIVEILKNGTDIAMNKFNWR